jgi:hypothetical protein
VLLYVLLKSCLRLSFQRQTIVFVHGIPTSWYGTAMRDQFNRTRSKVVKDYLPHVTKDNRVSWVQINDYALPYAGRAPAQAWFFLATCRKRER